MDADLERLRERVRGLVSDPNTQEMAAHIASDLAVLGARAGAGEDVGSELAHLKAQAANLSVGLQQRVGEAVLSWLRELSFRVVAGALAGISA